MTTMRVASVSGVIALFAASLAIGWMADGLPTNSLRAERLHALSVSGKTLTLVVGIGVGFFWLFWDRSRKRH
ncbi:hypothetical protein ACIPJ2_14730 [Curtobacterium sp. NPDC090217]|uniref:hypothetical protein n=1 Tax=Curtobacterium sp. NPDC090217 TaxID=3363970 RepID=UPI0037F9CA27